MASRVLSDGAVLIQDVDALRVARPGAAEWWRALQKLDVDDYARTLEVARSRGWI